LTQLQQQGIDVDNQERRLTLVAEVILVDSVGPYRDGLRTAYFWDKLTSVLTVFASLLETHHGRIGDAKR
jgi:hypothetical protein